MSFFRIPGDDSGSGETSISRQASTARFDENDHSMSRVQTIGSNRATTENSTIESTDTFSPSSAPATFHTNALLHSLLEDRCMTESLAELQAQGIRVENRDDPRVKALGSSKYSKLVQDLSALNVIKRGIDGQQYSPLRHNYLGALSMLSQQHGSAPRPQLQKASSSVDMALPANFRKYANGPMNLGGVDRQFGNMTLAENPPNTIVEPRHYLLDNTKYSREFDEFGILGKGGYGVVFHVKHKLDGGSYAVKKIPIGDRRLRKIQQNDQQEMDNILLELQTLARLNHPNVVRYHTGWIEYAEFSASGSQSHARRKMIEPLPDSERAGADLSGVDIQFQFDEDEKETSIDAAGTGWGSSEISATNNNVDDQGIMFEYSSDKSQHIDQKNSSNNHHSGSLNLETGSYIDNGLEKMRSRSTLASVDDEEIEVIPRHDTTTSSSESVESPFSDQQGTMLEPCLALHIQMSLYSMTLADFLSPQDGTFESSTISSLRHCFHPSSSLLTLLSLMDGTRYLHKQGIVHRDLKPGNIFLAIRPGTDCPPGAVDLSSCEHCKRMTDPRPFNMDVCIGDFGLVSAIAKEEEAAPVTPFKIVGTEIYRPEHVTRGNHPSLDFYALGIILFELLWKFDTKMERHEVLHALKRGVFPQDFDAKVGCPGLEQLVKTLVLAPDTSCPTWEALRAEITDLMRKSTA